MKTLQNDKNINMSIIFVILVVTVSICVFIIEFSISSHHTFVYISNLDGVNITRVVRKFNDHTDELQLVLPLAVIHELPKTSILSTKRRVAALSAVSSVPESRILEKGVWVWDSPDKMTNEHMIFLIEQIAANKFTAIYISLDDILSLLALQKTSERESKIESYNTALERFLKLAHEQGIAVDAEAGASEWAKPEYRYKAKTMLDFTKQFNATHGDKLRGVQFDVEPYLLSEYESHKKEVLTDYSQFVDETSRKFANSKLKLTFVIPHFFDNAVPWTPTVTVGGSTEHVFTHILRSLSRLPDTTIIIMSYRNYALGEGGAIELAQAELVEASEMTTGNTRIIIAQETGNVLPPYVTYFNTSRAYLESQTSKIDKVFIGYRVFGGIAIDYIDSFLALPK